MKSGLTAGEPSFLTLCQCSPLAAVKGEYKPKVVLWKQTNENQTDSLRNCLFLISLSTLACCGAMWCLWAPKDGRRSGGMGGCCRYLRAEQAVGAGGSLCCERHNVLLEVRFPQQNWNQYVQLKLNKAADHLAGMGSQGGQQPCCSLGSETAWERMCPVSPNSSIADGRGFINHTQGSTLQDLGSPTSSLPRQCDRAPAGNSCCSLAGLNYLRT